MEPKNPFKVASTKRLGSVNRLFRKAPDPDSARDGPQLKIFSFPAAPASATTAAAPPSMRHSRKPMATTPATVKVRACTTLVQTTALIPPQAM